jgi:ABC-type sugar transport system permease subunit
LLKNKAEKFIDWLVKDMSGTSSLADKLLPYVFVGPVFLFYFLLILLPVFSTFKLSFYKWSGLGEEVWVGLDNFVEAFSDPIALQALKNNIIWVIMAITIPVGIALLLVVLLANKVPSKVRMFFQTVYYIPAIVALVVTAITWGWIYNPIYGINNLLRTLNLSFLTQSWLGNANIALYSIFVGYVWTYFGFCVLILLAAIQKLDPSLYDAADIDGANGWQKFWHITLPGLKNELNFVVIMTAISGFKVFALPYVMTGGGPHHSTEVVATLIYRNAFTHHRAGYASAVAIILTIIVVVISQLSLYLRERNA